MITHSRAVLFCGNVSGNHTWYDIYYKKGVDTPVEEEEVKEEFIQEEEFKV